MEFLNKINNLYKLEAAVSKARKFKSSREKAKDKVKESESLNKVGFSSLTNTRKLTPMIEEELSLTDPFYFDNTTWTKFLRKVAPHLIVALMLDMGILPLSKKSQFYRHLLKQIKPK